MENHEHLCIFYFLFSLSYLSAAVLYIYIYIILNFLLNSVSVCAALRDSEWNSRCQTNSRWYEDGLWAKERKILKMVTWGILCLFFLKYIEEKNYLTCFHVLHIAEKGVPRFWLMALNNNDVTSEDNNCSLMSLMSGHRAWLLIRLSNHLDGAWPKSLKDSNLSYPLTRILILSTQSWQSLIITCLDKVLP